MILYLEQGTVYQEVAEKNLERLLKCLEDGVSLLIFVMEKGRIKDSLHENYNIFVDAICKKKVPVILLITHCEIDENMGSWWDKNKNHFDRYG